MICRPTSILPVRELPPPSIDDRLRARRERPDNEHWLRPRRVHLIGGAGAGMQALANLLREAGCALSGSDAAVSANQQAALPWLRPGHSADQLPNDCELVVYSPAIGDDNPELRRAMELGLPTLSYPAMLGHLMAERRGVAIAGTHGKSTTTAMTASILRCAGLDPTVLVGAEARRDADGAGYGRSEWLVAEACEYRQHFCHLRPELAVLLGIEWDHVDCFGTLNAVCEAFRRFVDGVEPKGKLLVSANCRRSREIAGASSRAFETFGLAEDADWRACDLVVADGHYSFGIAYHGQRCASPRLRVPGRHNVVNALAAAAVAWHCGASNTAIGQGLSDFAGLKRRLEPLGTRAGVALVDDYAHHPTEIAASLASLRACYPGRRLWCVFQPHQASRTAALLDELAESLQNADRVLVADVFLAREASASRLDLANALALRVPGLARACAVSRGEIVTLLGRELCPGDVLVTMGAGDIGNIAYGIIERL